MGTMTAEAQKKWDDYMKNRIPPGKWVLTPEQEAAIDNSPYFKAKEERAIRMLKKHPIPWGEIIWKD